MQPLLIFLSLHFLAAHLVLVSASASASSVCVCVCMSLSLSVCVCVCLSTHLIRKMSHKSSRNALSGQSRVKASWRRVACAKSISQSSIYNLASSNSASKSFAPNENAVKISKIVSSEHTTNARFISFDYIAPRGIQL